MSMLPCVVGSIPPIYASKTAWMQVKCFACETFAPVRLSFTEVIHGKT